MGKELAVVGTILEPQGIMTAKGTVTITGLLSTKVKCEGKFVYRNPLTFTSSGGSATGYISGTVRTNGPQNIPSTST